MKALLAELRAFLTGSQDRARLNGQYGPLLDLEVAADIAGEAQTASTQHRHAAHAARCADDEAASLLDRVLADGRVSDDEMPDLQTALRHIRRSAAHDQALSEAL